MYKFRRIIGKKETKGKFDLKSNHFQNKVKYE